MRVQKLFDGRIVLITGATRGIGLNTALTLASMGATVIATGRASSIERLRKQDNCAGLILLPLDMSDHDQIREVVHHVIQHYGRIDFLINNAATMIRSLVVDLEEEEVDEQIAVNFKGPTELIRLALPHMQRRRGGHILNISSVGGMMAMPCMGMYNATKFALEGLTESLWYECRPYKIRVTLIQPGFTLSGALDHVHFSNEAQSKIRRNGGEGAAYMAFEDFVRRLYRLFGTPEQDVVKTIVRALSSKNPALRYPSTRDALFFFWLRRFIPRRLYHWALYRGLPKQLRTPAPQYMSSDMIRQLTPLPVSQTAVQRNK